MLPGLPEGKAPLCLDSALRSAMSSMGALDRLRARRAAQHDTAASSHIKNEEYMNDFEKAWSEMTGQPASAELKTTPETQISSRPQCAAYKSTHPSAVNDGWLTGPVDESGSLSPIVSAFCTAEHQTE